MENQKTETVELPKPDSANSTPDGNSELRQVVKESVDKISNAAPIPIKRGPGRPRKNPLPENSAALGMPTAAPVALQQSAAPPPDISKLITPAISALSKIPADRHNIPGLAFDETESRAVAESLQSVLDAFIPDFNRMSPKTAAVVGLGITCGSIAVAKMNLYGQVMRERQRQAAAENGSNPTEGPVDAVPTMRPGYRPAAELFNN